MRTLFVAAIAALSVAGAASVHAHDGDRNYWGNGNDKQIWRNSYGECWQTGAFDKSRPVIPECGGKAAAPAAPVATAPAAAPASSGADDAAALAQKATNEAAAAAAAALAAAKESEDDDGDGVPNKKDQCPKSAAGSKVDEKGCYIVLKETVTITLHVNFASGSAKLDTAGSSEVKKLADFLTEYPETSIEVGGHTDNTGNAAANKRLSQARADAVRNELINKFGVDGGRVTAVGYGSDKPVADNGTAAGRADNRRVEGVVNQVVEKVQN